jgi:hypothetical protein
MYRKNSYWTLTEGWDPPPQTGISGDERRNQFHLRISTGNLVESLRLPVIIRGETAGDPASSFHWRKDKGFETAIFPDSSVSVAHSGPIVARLSCAGNDYTIDGRGLS